MLLPLLRSDPDSTNPIQPSNAAPSPKTPQNPIPLPHGPPGALLPEVFPHLRFSHHRALFEKQKPSANERCLQAHGLLSALSPFQRPFPAAENLSPPPSPYQGPEQIHSLNPSLLHPALSKIYGAGSRNFPHQQRTRPAPNERIVSLQAA